MRCGATLVGWAKAMARPFHITNLSCAVPTRCRINVFTRDAWARRTIDLDARRRSATRLCPHNCSPLRHTTGARDNVGRGHAAGDRSLQRCAIEWIKLELEPARFLDQRRIAKGGVERLAQHLHSLG